MVVVLVSDTDVNYKAVATDMVSVDVESVLDTVVSGPGNITKIVSYLSPPVTIARGLTTSGIPIIGEACCCSIVLL